MKNFWASILVVLIVIVLGFYMVTFQVRETEKVLVTRLGQARRTIDKPGLYLKWPSPIERVHTFDSRAYLYEGTIEETTTRGGEPIIVTAYMVWNIGDPLKFLESVGDKRGAEVQLRSMLRDKRNSTIGKHYFSEFVNSDPEKIRFQEIEKEMLSSIKDQAMDTFGINVRLVGIKHLGVSEKVTQDVFDRMKADRERKVKATLAQGTAEATKIKQDAESKKIELMAVAKAQAKAIRGAGDAEAAEHYKKLEADPDFAMFLLELESLKKILKDRSTVVLDGETEPINLLKSLPKIEPK